MSLYLKAREVAGMLSWQLHPLEVGGTVCIGGSWTGRALVAKKGAAGVRLCTEQGEKAGEGRSAQLQGSATCQMCVS